MIVNPAAGNGRALEIGKAVAQKLKKRGVDFDMHMPETPEAAVSIARAAAERGVETVIVLGGDGTVHNVAACLCGTQTALGIIPSGTGNDFIKSAGIPNNWEKALDFIFSHPPRPVDSGRVNDDFFLNECGTGFDVATLEFADAAKKWVRGLLPYLYGVIRALFAFDPIPMHIEIGDDVVIDGKCLVCAIANGSYIGGGIPIASGADLRDSLLDVLVVDAVPRWQLPFLLPSLMKGTLHENKRIAHRYLTTHCSIRCNHMRLNIDGDIRPVAEAHFRCQPGSLLLHW